MDMRFEKRTAFYVSGYSVETSEASFEKDCAMIWTIVFILNHLTKTAFVSYGFQ